jgi:hypothetical protein
MSTKCPGRAHSPPEFCSQTACHPQGLWKLTSLETVLGGCCPIRWCKQDRQWPDIQEEEMRHGGDSTGSTVWSRKWQCQEWGSRAQGWARVSDVLDGEGTTVNSTDVPTSSPSSLKWCFLCEVTPSFLPSSLLALLSVFLSIYSLYHVLNYAII